jgi:predicted nucleotidyltransferase
MRDYIPLKPQYIQNFERYSALATAWDYTVARLEELRTRLTDQFSKDVVTVALAGSLGRLEASRKSDVDYIMIVTDESKGPENIGIMNRHLAELRFDPPNPKGVFAKARTVDELVSKFGDADEPLDLFGKRLLLLLECRPIFHPEGFEECVKKVFDRYANYVLQEPTKEFVVLLNDLIRYFRAICVNYESSFIRENEKWTIRNIKCLSE